MTRRLALSIDRQCALAGLPVPVPEFRFHPVRRWRFDWAFPNLRVAVEIDGAVYVGGRHTRGSGFEKDMEKLNEALLLGWRVLRFSTGMVANGRALATLERIFQPGIGGEA